MPEKMTKEEAKVEQAIRALRKAKELLQEEGRNTLPYDADEAKEMKIKTPKAVKADKITNETQDKEGYGLAGEVFGKNETFYVDNQPPKFNSVEEMIFWMAKENIKNSKNLKKMWVAKIEQKTQFVNDPQKKLTEDFIQNILKEHSQYITRTDGLRDMWDALVDAKKFY